MGRKFGSELVWAILNAIADGVETFENAVYRPSALLRYGLQDLKILDAERERSDMNRALRTLKRQKLVVERRNGERRAFALTELGQERLMERKLPPKLQSGFQTIVVFDIPERYKEARVKLRKYLRSLQFMQLQKSVWISDLDWGEGLVERFKEAHIEEWISIYQGQKRF
ncbi:hypothetical protein KKF59_03445 [Patescibacteria group bacterium]|nr:hypothetical protein [Patescibacteria group bacterium]MBU1034427.1 hypothetical protein [Patescibacteria group bacterium]MBU1629896.1 hypothetical protein [Patescibacteria group bacterium]MBU1908156.1 hypothetical protein [Patescibacteria group bacterium]